jgi:hypothetical protein
VEALSSVFRQLERQYGKESVKLIPLLLTMGSVTEVEGSIKKQLSFTRELLIWPKAILDPRALN